MASRWRPLGEMHNIISLTRSYGFRAHKTTLTPHSSRRFSALSCVLDQKPSLKSCEPKHNPPHSYNNSVTPFGGWRLFFLFFPLEENQKKFPPYKKTESSRRSHHTRVKVTSQGAHARTESIHPQSSPTPTEDGQSFWPLRYSSPAAK